MKYPVSCCGMLVLTKGLHIFSLFFRVDQLEEDLSKAGDQQKLLESQR